MLFKTTNKLYTDRVVKHLASFVKEYSLFKKESELLLAVSGGIDSIMMLHGIHELRRYGYSCSVRVININHGTRAEQADEAQLVSDICNGLGFEFKGFNLDGLDTESNFENNARKMRYQVFDEIKKPNELLLLAHHIDDSYEWSILQSLRSSSVDGAIGIPVVNGSIRRPLMCLTKKQITRYAKVFDLPYLEDPTNEQTKHERNFLRHQIISGLGNRHPQYLKHYVYRQNELARRLGKHLIHSEKNAFTCRKGNGFAEIYNISSGLDFSGFDYSVIKAVQFLNGEGRGTLQSQIQKIKQAMLNNKYGPLTLTGGMKAYISFNHVLLLTKAYKADSVLQEKGEFTSYSLEQYRKLLQERMSTNDGSFAYPLWVCLAKRKFGLKPDKRKHPLFQSHSKYYFGLNLLKQWSKEKNQNQRVSLKLVTLGLMH